VVRNNWSVICRGHERNERGAITLHEVVSELNFFEPLPDGDHLILPLTPSLWLISQWHVEDAVNQKVYPAVARWLWAADNEILRQTEFELDFRRRRSIRTFFEITELDFLGEGQYEYHIAVQEFGEWEVKSWNIVLVANNVR